MAITVSIVPKVDLKLANPLLDLIDCGSLWIDWYTIPHTVRCMRHQRYTMLRW